MTPAATIQWTGVLTLSPSTTGDLAYIQNIQESLDRIAELPRNWDQEGGEPIGQRVLSIANELLLPLARLQPPIPRIAPVLGGGLQFEWRAGPRELEIEILPDGSVEYLTIDGAQTQEGLLPDLPKQAVMSLVEWLMQRR